MLSLMVACNVHCCRRRLWFPAHYSHQRAAGPSTGVDGTWQTFLHF